MTTITKTPCDEAMMQSGDATAGCTEQAKPWVLAAAILGSSLAFIDSSVVNVALPAMQAAFSTSIANMQWVINAYALMLGALVLSGGSAGDHYGRRKIFTIGIAVFAGASIWSGLASSIWQLIMARGLQGVGGALLIPNSLALISANFDDNDRGRAIGTWSAFSALTTALGPMLGGWLVDSFSWRFIFFVNVPLALAALGIAWRKVPESLDPGNQHGLDWWGALLATAGLSGICYGLIQASDLGFASAPVLATLIGGIAMLGAFLWVEWNQREPMMPPSLFRSQTFSGANLLTLCLYFALSGVMFFLPFNFIQVQGYSATAAGAAFLPFSLLVGGLSRYSGALAERFGSKRMLTAGPVCVAAGFLLLALLGHGGSYWTSFFPGIVVIGLGMAASVAPLTTTVLSAVSQDESGTASGINNAVSRVSGMLSVALLGAVAVLIFSGRLGGLIDAAGIPAGIRSRVMAHATNLAKTTVPENASSPIKYQISGFINQSFIHSFQWVMFIAAALALAGAFVAWQTIKKEEIND